MSPRPLYTLARGATRSLGRATALARVDPQFLIVGAQRCGTTSMHQTLTQHPAVLPAGLFKGVHYFDTGYHHGHRWYRGHFPLRATIARASRDSGMPAITGESSPYYLFHPLAAERIARDLPGVRVLVLVRDPVERAYSAYTHETARGFETEPFEVALAREPERLAGEADKIIADPGYYSFSHQHHGYLSRGRYVEQLTRLEGLLGRSRIHVVDSEEFFARPAPVFGEVLNFLGLAPRDGIRFEQHNARPRAPMPPSLRNRLAADFAADDEELGGWLGRTPWWRR